VLAAAHRLRDSDAFRRTVSSGRRAGGAALVVHLLDGAGDAAEAGPRVGLVVGKAVGNAVVRNRVKRQLRHLVMNHLTDLPPRSDLVIRALPPAAGMPSPELGVQLARCLERVGSADLRRAPVSARTGSVMRAEP
jgi:ribonuclease P protein component